MVHGHGVEIVVSRRSLPSPFTTWRMQSSSAAVSREGSWPCIRQWRTSCFWTDWRKSIYCILSYFFRILLELSWIVCLTIGSLLSHPLNLFPCVFQPFLFYREQAGLVAVWVSVKNPQTNEWEFPDGTPLPDLSSSGYPIQATADAECGTWFPRNNMLGGDYQTCISSYRPICQIDAWGSM